MVIHGDASEIMRLETSKEYEKVFQQWLKKIAEVLGYLYYHTRDSRGSDKGFPDTVMVGHGRVIFAELKSLRRGRSKPTADQWKWINALDDSGIVEVYVWYPDQKEEIVELLNC